MDIDRVFSIGAAIDGNDGEYWKNEIDSTLSDEHCLDHNVNLGDILLSIYAHKYPDVLGNNASFIAYGAGRRAETFLPILMEKLCFSEIWDAFSTRESMESLKISKPVPGKENVTIVVFIDDYEIRKRAIDNLRKMGYKDIYYYRYCLCATQLLPQLSGIEKFYTARTEAILETIEQRYSLVNSSLPSVFFSALPNDMNESSNIVIGEDHPDGKALYIQLEEALLLSKSEQEKKAIIDSIDNCDWRLKHSVASNIEILLRNILQGGVKTKYRPLKMFRDIPFDPFATFETTLIIIKWLQKEPESQHDISQLLLSLNRTSLVLKAIKAHLLAEAKRLDEAIELARGMIHTESNSLLAGEVFFDIAKRCKENGIFVEEPIPQYELSDYFCWSGINFAWCGGYDRENDRAEWAPCFRPLQCAARPNDEFWCGEDWKEFRKSLMDGSFRYCQKNQCPNLVAGWLPRKDKIEDETTNRIIGGDFNAIPKLEELHFSYDEHCNLCCPSCRTEFKTIDRSLTDQFDNFYNKHLKEQVKTAKHLCLSGCGEAMISPHSSKILKSLNINEYPYLEVELRTNMTTITPQAWEALGEGRKVIRHIAASIDSSRKEDFERIRYPAKWENVCKNLEFVQKLRNTGELDVFEFHVVIQKDNVDQLLEIVKLAISYDVDVVTFSRLINWREMPEEEYDVINPFWINNEYHEQLKSEIKKVIEFRDSIENDSCDFTKGKKKIFINMHFEPDPSDRYDEIRYGRYKIR